MKQIFGEKMKNKDERESHFFWSIWKSGLRCAACIFPIAGGFAPWAWVTFLVLFFAAEILGIVEEL